jgi:uncharacterized protein (UPF0264 family)
MGYGSRVNQAPWQTKDRPHLRLERRRDLQLLVDPVGSKGRQQAVAVTVDAEHGRWLKVLPTSLIGPACYASAEGDRAAQPMAQPRPSIELVAARRQAGSGLFV